MSGQKETPNALKQAILEKVREENQRMFDPHPPSKAASRVALKKSPRRRFTGFALALVAGLSIFLFFSLADVTLKASRLDSTAQQQQTRENRSPSLPDSLAKKEPAATLPLSLPQILATYSTNDLVPVDPVDFGNYDILVNNSDLRLTALFGLEVHNIVIDPGHGGKDPGATGRQGTMEKKITLDIAHRLKDILEEKTPFDVYLTRETDETVSLSDRVKFANAVNADLFISIHVNSIPEHSINTIETYYFGPPPDEKTIRLAERENAHSMYSSADFNKIIQKIGNTLKQQESMALAIDIQRNLFANIRKHDKDVHNWGVKVAPFMVLLDVEAPAVLTEISCISEPAEEKKLKTADYRNKIASYIANGIIAYLIPRQEQAQRGDEDGFKKDS